MISRGFKLKAYGVKRTGSGKLYFKVLDFNKKSPKVRRYVTVFCNNNPEIEEEDMIKITEITGLGYDEFDGKLSGCMFASVELADEKEEEIAEVMTEKTEVNEKESTIRTEISSDDLPF